MQISTVKTTTADVLVIGSGLAGIRAVIEAAKYSVDVHLVEKSIVGYNNNSRFSGGGFRCSLVSGLPKYLEGREYVNVYGTPEDHFKDSLLVGEFLNDQPLTEAMCFDMPSRIMEFRDLGVESIPHTYHYCNYPHGTGYMKFLVESAYKLGVKSVRRMMIFDLLTKGSTVTGAIGLDMDSGYLIAYSAKAVVLATGGAGRLYERNEVTTTTTGEGLAMAYRAGAKLINMEIVQFEPYVHAETDLPMMDRHESQAAFFGPLRNSLGEDFLPNYIRRIDSPNESFHKQFGAYMPDIRYVVARAMATEVHEGRGVDGYVWFDMSKIPKDKWKSDFASGYLEKVLSRGRNVREGGVHVFPAVITTLGGVEINDQCETNLEGLYAAGEVTGGVHGAMRLGGNALADALVFGARAGISAAKKAITTEAPDINMDQVEERKRWINGFLERQNGGTHPDEVKKKIQSAMWKYVGIIRTGEGIRKAIDALEEIGHEISLLYAEDANMVRKVVEAFEMQQVALAIAKSALAREESRGGHFRLDFPIRDDERWLKKIVVKKVNGSMQLSTAIPQMTRYRPGDPRVNTPFAKVLESIEMLKRKKYGK